MLFSRFCPHCKDHVCAENITYVDKLPDVLVLQLERFEFIQGYGSYSSRRKISSHIDFPIHDLNMNEWLYKPDAIKEENCIYDLKAICNHTGSSSGGHYYCYACDENEGQEVWNEYNDSAVYPIQASSLVQSTAYVLFYQRRSSNQDTKELISFFESMNHPEPPQSLNSMLNNLSTCTIEKDKEAPRKVDDSIDDIYLYECLLNFHFPHCIFHKMPYYGDTMALSIGESICTASYIVNDTIEVISSIDNRNFFPTIATFFQDNIVCCNDPIAKMNPERTIRHSMHLLGKCMYDEQVEMEKNNSFLPIEENEKGEVAFRIDNNTSEYWTVEMILTKICAYLKERVERIINKEIHNCILAYPDSLDSSQQNQLKKAVEACGLTVQAMEKESICIGYYIEREIRYEDTLHDWKNRYTFIFSLNESDCSTSIIDFVDDKPHLVSTNNHPSLSGDRIINLVIQHVESYVNHSFGVDLLNGMAGEKTWQKDYSTLYHTISEQLFFLSQVDCIYIEYPAVCRRQIRKKSQESVEEVKITREELFLLFRDYTERLKGCLASSIRKCGIPISSIYRVIPTGLYSHLFFVMNTLMCYFGDHQVYKSCYCNSSISYGLGELLLKWSV